MRTYAVVLDPAMHRFIPKAPPLAAVGGVVGESDKGLVAVYVVPPECIDAFSVWLDANAAIKQWHDITDRDVQPQ